MFTLLLAGSMGFEEAPGGPAQDTKRSECWQEAWIHYESSAAGKFVGSTNQNVKKCGSEVCCCKLCEVKTDHPSLGTVLNFV